ncbi:MAG: shikimate dehydrogenase [Candidatus Omnitrophica bacterium]|nr:shikimate dehydrogenase [Candidatus Omnitrophota bacterium]
MNKFGFVVHPIDAFTFKACTKPWFLLEKILPKEMFENILTKLPPKRFRIFKKVRSMSGKSIDGDMLTISLLPSQIYSFPEETVLRLIGECIKYCERSGAKIVGLGGFTSVIGNEGEALSRRVKVPLTSGNTLTAALALQGIYKAAYAMELSLPSAVVAVIGATGDIGSICTKILSKRVKKVNIAARNEEKLQEFASRIRQEGSAEVRVFKYSKDAVREADIVLTVTSAITTVVDPVSLKPGSIVCDVAMPANIAREVVQARDDILVFEGGLAKIPYPEDCKIEKLSTAFPPNGIYGCLAETMTLAFEERFESFSLGRGNITESKITEIESMAKKHGIALADFFCGYKTYTKQDIENIRKNAKKNKEVAYAAQK